MMTKVTIEQTAEFDCKSTSGALYVVQEWTRFSHYPTMSNEDSTPVRGTREYRTQCGLDLNLIDESTFKVVQTDEILERI